MSSKLIESMIQNISFADAKPRRAKRQRKMSEVPTLSKELEEKEQWKPYPGDCRYTVSDMGRVKGTRGQLLRTPPNNAGYLVVGIGGLKLVHRVVLEAFVGPCPEGLEACHYNDEHSDNRLENLRWDTHESNVEDKKRNGKVNNGYTVKS